MSVCHETMNPYVYETLLFVFHLLTYPDWTTVDKVNQMGARRFIQENAYISNIPIFKDFNHAQQSPYLLHGGFINLRDFDEPHFIVTPKEAMFLFDLKQKQIGLKYFRTTVVVNETGTFRHSVGMFQSLQEMIKSGRFEEQDCYSYNPHVKWDDAVGIESSILQRSLKHATITQNRLSFPIISSLLTKETKNHRYELGIEFVSEIGSEIVVLTRRYDSEGRLRSVGASTNATSGFFIYFDKMISLSQIPLWFTIYKENGNFSCPPKSDIINNDLRWW
jgi:hypothetical protein